jgi:hypothetical protein
VRIYEVNWLPLDRGLPDPFDPLHLIHLSRGLVTTIARANGTDAGFAFGYGRATVWPKRRWRSPLVSSKGAVRSSVETVVMAVERRGGVIQQAREINRATGRNPP